MGTRGTVLVVDDEPAICELLDEVFSFEGYAVRSAHDGLEALAEVDREAPDVVLADVMMPWMDGVGLAAHLQRKGVPVVLMSAAVAAPAVSAVAFIRKPFDVPKLLATVAGAVPASSSPAVP